MTREKWQPQILQTTTRTTIRRSHPCPFFSFLVRLLEKYTESTCKTGGEPRKVSQVLIGPDNHMTQQKLSKIPISQPPYCERILVFPFYLFASSPCLITRCGVPACSPSRGGEVMVYVFDVHQPSLPTSFYPHFVSISVFMALSTVFYSINSPNNCPFFHSVLLVLSQPYWSFELYISVGKSPSALI